MSKLQNYALVFNPLSPLFQSKLEALIGEPITYLQFSELRKQSLWKIYQNLNSLRANYLLLPIEFENIKLFLPNLKMLTAAIKAKKILIVKNDLSSTRFHKYQIFSAILNFFIQSAINCTSYWRFHRQASQLAKSPYQHFRANSSAKALYLDSSIWLGTIAGGSVGHITGVVNSLITHGYNVDFAGVDKLPLLSTSIQFLKIKLPKLFTIPAELNRFYMNNKMISELSQNVSNYQFIYQRLALENYAGVELSRLFRIPLIIEYNGSSIWVFKNWSTGLRFSKLAGQCEEICFKHAHLIVTISEVLKDELIELGIPAKKIVCYPNGINPVIFNPDRFTDTVQAGLRKQLKIPENALVLTFIGTFGDWHGIDILAKAICQFFDTYPIYLQQQPVRFLLIGNGQKMALIKDILQEPHAQGNVIFTDIIPQDQAPEYLAISDIFLSPHVPNKDGSRFFGSPTKLFEYMCMGKAIIASNLEQIGQILNNSLDVENLPIFQPATSATEMAILCQPGNVDHVVKAMLFLIKNPLWRKKLGENARQEVLAKYTWDNHVAIILEKLKELIS